MGIAIFWLNPGKNLGLAPDLVFKTITGTNISLKALQGKPVLVTFWATDCPSCIAEIPHLIDLYHKQHCLGLEIIGITMAYDPPNHVVEMTKAKQIPYPVVLDLNGEYSQAFGNIMVTPNTFLIAPDGRIAKHYLGASNPDSIKQHIAVYLKDNSCSG